MKRQTQMLCVSGAASGFTMVPGDFHISESRVQLQVVLVPRGRTRFGGNTKSFKARLKHVLSTLRMCSGVVETGILWELKSPMFTKKIGVVQQRVVTS